jgi:hypothetical protein
MTGHTPGPWVWVGRYLVPASAAGEDYPALFAVADDGSAYGEYTETLVPGSSDGRLIAAAPELLEALELMVEAYEHEASPHNPALLAARAAIAKAVS